jgi:hypothetical protein
MNAMMMVAGGAIIAALAVGIGTKLGSDEAKTVRMLAYLEKQPDGAKGVAALLFFQDKCQVDYPRPVQAAIARYADAHPQARREANAFLFKTPPQNGAEAFGQAIGEEMFERMKPTMCSAIKRMIAKVIKDGESS